MLPLAAFAARATSAAGVAPTPPAGLVDVRAKGLRGDGRSDDADALVGLLRREPGGRFFFPEGTYRIDNTPKPGSALRVNGRIQIDYFRGMLWFEAGANLLFDRQNVGGLIFNGGEGARFYSMTLAYRAKPTTRLTDHSALFFNRTSRTLVEGCRSLNSPGPGMLFWSCLHPTVRAASVSASAADGIHFANCAQPRAIGVRTFDTGDDGLAFVSYKGENRNSGGYAYDIDVRRSRARGIAVVGQHGVRVENFLVDGTASSGVLIGNDDYSGQQPHNVTLRHGRVMNVGVLAPRVGNQDGLEIYAATYAAVDNVSVHAAPEPRTGRYAMRRGVSVHCLPGGALSPLGGTVELARVAIAGGETGAELRASRLLLGNAQQKKFGLTVAEAQRYGVFVADCPRVSSWNLTVRNAGAQLPREIAGRAVWFENNTALAIDGIHLADTRTPIRGYIAGFWREAASAAKQTGTVRRITSNLGSRLQIQRSRRSTGLVIGGSAVGHSLID